MFKKNLCSMMNRRALALLVSLSMVLQGCVTTQPHQSVEALDREGVPYRANQRYDAVMERVRHHLRAVLQNSEVQLIVQVKPILADAAHGGELPASLSNMLVTSLNQIAGAFPEIRVVPYDPAYTVNMARQGIAVRQQYPVVVIEGSITEFDKDLDSISERVNTNLLFGGGRGETDANITRSSRASISRVGIDLQVIDFRTNTYISHASTRNSVSLLNTSTQTGGGFFIMGNGFGVSGTIDSKQGMHKALRSLVDLSVVEALSKLLNVPWRVIMISDYTAEEAQPVLRSMVSEFEGKTQAQLVASIQREINFQNGLLGRNPISTDGVMGPVTRNELELLLTQSYAPDILVDYSSTPLVDEYIKLLIVGREIERNPEKRAMFNGGGQSQTTSRSSTQSRTLRAKPADSTAEKPVVDHRTECTELRKRLGAC